MMGKKNYLYSVDDAKSPEFTLGKTINKVYCVTVRLNQFMIYQTTQIWKYVILN